MRSNYAVQLEEAFKFGADLGKRGFGLATFMHAAGIICSQRLGDLLAGLEPAREQDAVRLLGAARPS